ncbi:MAG: lipopolysaccharide biosynthesis protein [Planctomycetota bacterium]
MRQSVRIMLNSGAMLGQQLLTMALQVFLLAFVLRQVSDEAYAIFLLATSLQMVLFMLRDAVTKGAMQRVAGLIETGEHDGVNRVVSSAMGIMALPAVLATVALFAGGGHIADFFGVRADLRETMRWTLGLTAVTAAIMLPLAPYNAIVFAHQRYDVFAASRLGTRVLRAVIIVLLFVLVRADVIFVMLATVAGEVIAQVVLVVAAYRLQPALRVRLHQVDRATLKGIVGFGSFLVCAQLAAMGGMESVKWYVGKVLSIETVTHVTIAIYLYSVFKRVVQPMTVVLVPVASKYKAANDRRTLGVMFSRGSRYSAMLGLAAACMVLPIAGPLLGLWLKPEMAWIGPFAATVAVVGALSLPSSCAAQMLNGIGDAKRPFWITSASAVVTLGGTALAIALGLGYTGAIIGICAGRVTLAVGFAWVALRAFPLRVGRFLWTAYGQPIIAAGVASAVGLLLADRLQPATWLPLMLTAGVTGLTYVASFVPFVSQTERSLLRSATRKGLAAVGIGRGQA